MPANGRGLQAVVIVQILEQVREDEGRQFAPVGTLAHPSHVVSNKNCAKSTCSFSCFFFLSHYLALFVVRADELSFFLLLAF